jgi:hypothetical protein
VKVGDLVRVVGSGRFLQNMQPVGSKESCSGMIIEIDSDNWAQVLSTEPRMTDPDGYPCLPGVSLIAGCRLALIFWTPIIMCEVISES